MSATRVEPLHDLVVLRVPEIKRVTIGGIVMPDAVATPEEQNPWGEGIVEEVGPGIVTESGNRAPIQVKKGDRVLYKKGTGIRVKLETGEQFLMFQEQGLLAILHTE